MGENTHTQSDKAVSRGVALSGGVIEVGFGRCTTITGVHSNQDHIWLVKIGDYIGFYVDRRS